MKKTGKKKGKKKDGSISIRAVHAAMIICAAAVSLLLMFST